MRMKIALALVMAGLCLLGNNPSAQALGSRDAAAEAAMASFAGSRNGLVVWQSRRTGPFRIFASALDGTNLRQLSPDVSGKDHLAALISPDGKRVIYYQTATVNSDTYYDDHLGQMMMVQASDTKGSTAQKLVDEVRTFFECRFARWIDDDSIAYIGKDHNTYRYTISSGQSAQLFTYPLDSFGALPNRQLTWAIDGGNRIFELKGGQAIQRKDFDGCEGNMAADGLWAYRVEGSEGPNGVKHDFARMKLGSWDEEFFFDNHSSALPSGQNYIYFPQLSSGLRYLALGASANVHDHFTSDYDIFLVEIDPSSFTPKGQAVKYSFDGALDAYPDVWVAPDGPVTPELTTIEVSGTNVYILKDGEARFTARLVDQQGAPFAAEVSWSVSGGGAITPAASGAAVEQSTATFQSAGTAGTFTVTAQSGEVSGSATIEVIDLDFPLQINCGSNDHDVTGWMRDDRFVEGGQDYVNDSEVDTAGVAGAAPAEVYRSMRHQSPHSYTLPVPDGLYRLKIHFADPYDLNRSLNYTAEGQPVITDLDVTTAAGGVFKAYIEQVEVTVTGGDGLLLEAEGRGDEGDVFEAGLELEVISITEPPPLTDSGAGAPGADGGGSSTGGDEQIPSRREPLSSGCAVGPGGPTRGAPGQEGWSLLLLGALILLRRRRRHPRRASKLNA